MRPLYLDYNATTPVHPDVMTAMLPWLQAKFGNPGSTHHWGMEARQGLETARQQVAKAVGAEADEIIFTSGATESNNLALYGMLTHPGKQHLVISAVEHPAIMQPGLDLRAKGFKLTIVPVNREGMVCLENVQAACTKETTLISIMLANNEVGTIQPIGEIAAWARQQGIPVHTDAAQAVGKIPVDVKALGVDIMSIAGHKLYAPKGIGALFVRKGLTLLPHTRGGGQEQGIRPGTENIPCIAGLGTACTLVKDLACETARQQTLGERFKHGLEALHTPFVIHAHNAPRLPGTMSIGFPGRAATEIVSRLARYNVGVSAGSACHSGQTTISSVLNAMEVDRSHALGTIRFSWGRMTTTSDIDALLERLDMTLRSL